MGWIRARSSPSLLRRAGADLRRRPSSRDLCAEGVLRGVAWGTRLIRPPLRSKMKPAVQWREAKQLAFGTARRRAVTDGRESGSKVSDAICETAEHEESLRVDALEA